MPLSTDAHAEAATDIDENDRAGKPDQRRSDEPRIHLPRRRHISPWASRRLLLGSVIVAVLLVPLWLDPTTLREIKGSTRSPLPPDDSASQRPNPSSIAATPAPSGPPRVVFARDRFERQSEHGWGAADFGGTYEQVAQGFSALEVAAGMGLVRVGRDGHGVAMLSSAAATDVEAAVTVTLDTRPVGHTAAGVALRVDEDSLYMAALQLDAGRPFVVIQRWSGVDVTSIAGPIAVPGITNSLAPIRLRAEAFGSDPTTIRVKAWPAGEAEPDEWLASVIDWTGRLQRSGAVGMSWLAATLADGGADLRFDNFQAITSDGETR